jgi:hypothetical protein
MQNAAFFSEGFGHAVTDAARTAGDERSASFKMEFHG